MERSRSAHVAKEAVATVINIEDVIPGMVLAEPVRDATGRLLVTRGAAITRRLQRQLRLWGIPVVAVETSDELDIDPARDAHDDTAATDLIATFQSEPFMHELARLAQIRQDTRTPPKRSGEGDRP